MSPRTRAVLVSACLLGVACRWHGRKLYKSTFVKRFEAEHPEAELIPVCPEELAGLPTPRPPVKTVKGRIYETCAEKKRRRYITGREVTAVYRRGAEAALAIAKKHRSRLAILCRWSPSCARTGVAGKLFAKHDIEIIDTF